MKDNEIPVMETACGGKFKDPSKYPNAVHEGRIIYFCTDACRKAFYSDPDGFLAGKVEHPE